MSNILSGIWNDIKRGENIDLYVTISAAILLAVLNLFGLAQLWVNSVTLAVLALLAVSSLVNRRKLETVLNRLLQSTAKTLLDFMPPSREDELRKSKELWLIGIALNKTINLNYRLIQEKLTKGDKIKIILVDPNGVACKLVAARYYQPTNPEIIQNYILLTLKHLEDLKKTSPSNLEVRVLDYSPPIGILASNIQSPNGIIYVEHYQYKMGVDIPVLVIRRQDDYWYDFYTRQVQTLWENAVEWGFNQNV